MNKQLKDELYQQIGLEIGRKEFDPGQMARAVADAKGNKSLAESLYIKYRFEDLSREIELKERTKQQEAENLRESELRRKKLEKDYLLWPNCGYFGKPIIRSRGDSIEFLLLLLFLIIPGLIYAILYSGFESVCTSCRKIIVIRR